jgi:hypothetical protein
MAYHEANEKAKCAFKFGQGSAPAVFFLGDAAENG